jgi:hypothetical protein
MTACFTSQPPIRFPLMPLIRPLVPAQRAGYRPTLHDMAEIVLG